jgi:hypothetical protein
MIPIAQLLVAPTQAAIRAQMVSALVVMGVPADRWRTGGTMSSVLTVTSMFLYGMAVLVALAINSFFLPNATGQGLVNLAFYLYGITAPQPTQASGQYTFTNTQGGVYSGPSYAAGQVTLLDTATGITYVTTQDLNLGAVGSGTAVQTVGIQATVFGSVGNANPGDIDQIVTSMTGVEGTNAMSVVGTDGIPDVSLRALCLNSLGARSVRGPRSAYAFAIQTALNAVSGNPVNINRWLVSNSSSTGVVTVVVASPAGVPDANDVAGVGLNIEAVARPGAVTVNLSGATPIAYGPAATFWCTLPAGVTAAACAAAISSAITTFLSTYPIGGVTADDDVNPGGFTGLFADGVKAAATLGAVSVGAVMYSSEGLTDQALTSSQVATNSVTVTVRTIPVPT